MAAKIKAMKTKTPPAKAMKRAKAPNRDWNKYIEKNDRIGAAEECCICSEQ